MKPTAQATLIPRDTLLKWQSTFTRRAKDKLEALIELRAILREARDEGERVIMQMYCEAGNAMLYSPETLRHLIADLREYPDEKLRYWIGKGVTFEALRSINGLARYDMLNASPAVLFDEAVTLGNGSGKTMDKNELVSHAMGHNPHYELSYKVNVWLDKGMKMAKLTNTLNGRTDDFRREIKEVFTRYGVEL